MLDEFILPIVVFGFIAFVVFRQLQGVIGKVEANEREVDTSVYPRFATYVLDLVRDIKKDIDSSKETENPLFALKSDIDEKEALEKLSDIMRELLFFETMGARGQKSSEVEAKLFATLSHLDAFVSENLQDGQTKADFIRDELFTKFNELRN